MTAFSGLIHARLSVDGKGKSDENYRVQGTATAPRERRIASDRTAKLSAHGISALRSNVCRRADAPSSAEKAMDWSVPLSFQLTAFSTTWAVYTVGQMLSRLPINQSSGRHAMSA